MSKRILVVDDEPDISRLVKMSLAVDGYEVRTASSGFEALELLEEHLPDLLVLDIMMPGMNGYELCLELRKNPKTKKIKIVFLTARGNPGDAQQGFSLGADEYIIKPFNPNELLEKVKAILG